MEILDLKPFENAINSLNNIIIRYKKDDYDVDIRDAVIQRFEYTYSLTVKTITRFINIQSPEITNDMTFNELIRKANKLGLLKNDLLKWTEYRQKRNMTSHTYDETIANEVVKIIPEFKTEAEFILKKLKEQI